MMSPTRTTMTPRAGRKFVASGDLRRFNLAAVLRTIAERPDASRGAIARATGLTRTSVNSLVTELVEHRIVAERAPAARVGRPSPRLEFADGRFGGICVEVQQNAVRSVAGDLALRGLTQWRDDTHGLPAAETGRLVVEHLERALASVAGRTLTHVTLAVHGQLDTTIGAVRWNWGEQWNSVDVLRIAREILPAGVQVIVENNAAISAIAEYRGGGHLPEAAAGDLVAISSGRGIGVGVLFGGSAFHVGHGYVPEVGHFVIDPDGPECACGRRGCWSAHVGVDHVFREAMPEAAEALSHLREFQRLAAEALRSSADAGDERTLDVLDRTGRIFGQGAAQFANIFQPEVIVVGGYLAELMPWMRESAQKEFLARVMRPDGAEDMLHVSPLGPDLVLTGGMQLIRQAIIDDPAALIDRKTSSEG